MSRAVRADSPTAGFTVIEALVALLVVTVCIVAISSVMASNAQGVRRLESHVALVQVANNTLWLGIPSRGELVEGEFSGKITDFGWRARIEPVMDAIEPSTGEVQWLPERISLEVRSPIGAVLHVETLRLVKRSGK